MFKIKKSDLIFVLIVIIMITPITRNFLQKSIYKIVGKFNPIEAVGVPEQKSIAPYSGKLYDLKNNQEVDFSAFQNKVLVVNFWATWCPPCVAEMPSLISLYKKYKGDVSFLFISGEDPEELNEFLQKKNFDIPVYIPTENLPKNLGHKSIPVTFIIDKEGKIAVQNSGAADWNTKSVGNILDSLIQK